MSGARAGPGAGPADPQRRADPVGDDRRWRAAGRWAPSSRSRAACWSSRIAPRSRAWPPASRTGCSRCPSSTWGTPSTTPTCARPCRRAICGRATPGSSPGSPTTIFRAATGTRPGCGARWTTGSRSRSSITSASRRRPRSWPGWVWSARASPAGRRCTIAASDDWVGFEAPAAARARERPPWDAPGLTRHLEIADDAGHRLVAVAHGAWGRHRAGALRDGRGCRGTQPLDSRPVPVPVRRAGAAADPGPRSDHRQRPPPDGDSHRRRRLRQRRGAARPPLCRRGHPARVAGALPPADHRLDHRRRDRPQRPLPRQIGGPGGDRAPDLRPARGRGRQPHVQPPVRLGARRRLRRRAGAEDDGRDGDRLAIPGYVFSLEREVDGSVAYINQRLAPPGKPARVFLWSGDALPPEEAIERTDALGLENLNGDDAEEPGPRLALSQVPSFVRPVGRRTQIYAPAQNENVYTNLWHGPFYGFRRVVDYFRFTDSPRRLKPIGIYYHFYSGTKAAAIKALHEVYGWALQQETFPGLDQRVRRCRPGIPAGDAGQAARRKLGAARVRGADHRPPAGHAGMAGSRPVERGGRRARPAPGAVRGAGARGQRRPGARLAAARRAVPGGGQRRGGLVPARRQRGPAAPARARAGGSDDWRVPGANRSSTGRRPPHLRARARSKDELPGI